MLPLKDKHMKQINYEEDVSIDEYSLDIEWIEQPGLVLKYTKYQAQIKKELAQLREERDVVKAKLDFDIRSDPEKYGLEKVTVDGVNATITRSLKYQKIQEKLLEKEYEHNVVNGAVIAVQQRKDTLENLVKLLGMQYFAGPKAPRDITYERAQRAKRQESNSKISIKKRTRNK